MNMAAFDAVRCRKGITLRNTGCPRKKGFSHIQTGDGPDLGSGETLLRFEVLLREMPFN